MSGDDQFLKWALAEGKKRRARKAAGIVPPPKKATGAMTTAEYRRRQSFPTGGIERECPAVTPHPPHQWSEVGPVGVQHWDCPGQKPGPGWLEDMGTPNGYNVDTGEWE